MFSIKFISLGAKKSFAGVMAEIVQVASIAMGFAALTGAFCEFVLKPLWHALVNAAV